MKQKVRVPTGPMIIAPKGKKLLVRTYDTNLVFDVK